MTGHDWKTVAKKIKEIKAGKEYPKKKPHPRILDLYQEQIIKWLKDNLSGARIQEIIGIKSLFLTNSLVNIRVLLD